MRRRVKSFAWSMPRMLRRLLRYTGKPMASSPTRFMRYWKALDGSPDVGVEESVLAGASVGGEPAMVRRCLLLALVLLPGLIIQVVTAAANTATANPVVVQFHVTPSAPDPPRSVSVAAINEQAYTMDLTQLGIKPLAQPLPVSPPRTNLLGLPDLLNPDGGAVGVGGAYLSISHDVVSQTTVSEVGLLSANWLPGETVAVVVNGGLPANYTTDALGRVGVYLLIGAAQGYFSVDERGLTSGRQAGGAFSTRASVPTVPGLSIVPHAVINDDTN